MDKQNEAKKMIEEIKAMGFTQIQIAEEILVSPVTVSRWKSGKIEIPDGKLLALRGIILRAADAELIKAAEVLAEAVQDEADADGVSPLMNEALAAFRQAGEMKAKRRGDFDTNAIIAAMTTEHGLTREEIRRAVIDRADQEERQDDGQTD